MKKSLRLALCALVCLAACNKEVSETLQPTVVGPRLGGALPDDPEKLAKVPLIVSSDFLKVEGLSAIKPRGPKVVDSDGDGIADSNDACPTQKETFNGYQDGDGCPDTVPPSTTPDATAPTIAITAPANGTVVSGTVGITVNASDNVGVVSVSYTVDGVSAGSSNTAPFSFNWNSSSVAAGSHTIVARAFDAAGNTGAATITVSTNVTIVQPPSATGVSLFMPPVGNQGSEGSCVAWAVGYAARSAEQYYQKGFTAYSYTSNVFSPEFLYNQTKVAADCGSGTSPVLAMDFIKANGICTWQSMPYSGSNGCSQLPLASQVAEALNYKIAGYSKLINSDRAAIKAMIDAKHPVIFNCALDQSFVNAGPGYIWKSYAVGPGIGHTMVICGYDDSKGAYKVMNSWGTAWGDSGFGWIGYDFFPSATFYYVYVMVV